MPEAVLAPGARIECRSAEWLVRSLGRSSDGQQVVDVVGVSPFLREKEARFLVEVEKVHTLPHQKVHEAQQHQDKEMLVVLVQQLQNHQMQDMVVEVVAPAVQEILVFNQAQLKVLVELDLILQSREHQLVMLVEVVLAHITLVVLVHLIQDHL